MRYSATRNSVCRRRRDKCAPCRPLYDSGSKRMRPITAILLAWLMTAPVPAQQVEQATRGNARFGTTTQLIVEDVIVKGKDGNPVTGLKASDFTITEDGKAQKISVFEFQTLEQEAAPATVSAPRPSVEPVAPAAPPIKPVTAI